MAFFSYVFPASVELFILIASCVILMVGVFFPKRESLCYYLAQSTVVIAMGLTLWMYTQTIGVNGVPLYAYANGFVLDKLAVFLKLLTLLCALFTFIYARAYNKIFHLPDSEFYVLALLSILGMLVLISGNHFIVLYLGLELLSLPLYAMIAFQRTQARSIEASLKYFLIGAVASGFLLYGLSILFGLTQSMEIPVVAHSVATQLSQQWHVLLFAMVFVLAGIAFKLGLAPFHMWVPDVYDGAPNSVTLFVSAAPKVAAFGLLMRLLVEAMPAASAQWQLLLIVIAILSMAVGNIAAIVQTNIKRMLAYSSIAHSGYMLLGILCATSRGYAAALFYLLSYMVMTVGAFGVLTLLSCSGKEICDVDDMHGLNTRNPWLAFVYLLILFSMAGIPPMVGFMAKVGVLEALIQVHLTWLAIVAILFSVIGAFYYIRVIKVMYFETPVEVTPVVLPRDGQAAASINGVAVILLGILPGSLYALCHLVF
ncbi:MAG: NADH-quinone oxidoreductase subunit NuoN [Coxiellaceae bacterium]|nr:NADH-quinone oxidoreductase subunit NuoN [Coxiellaceae bacterium]|tara:strand:- start:962 stop:2410 length:1449 start_codon:yes stop_codon:yes gene_type:complete